MKRSSLSDWSATGCVLSLLLSSAAGCGGTAGTSSRDAGDAGSAGEDAAKLADLRVGTADASPEAMYSGVVLEMMTQDGTSTTYGARAILTAEERPVIGGCPRCCCGGTDRGLPLPDKPPDAGKLTITTAAGSTTLAILTPEVFHGDSGIRHGISDLGWDWFRPLSAYAPVSSELWRPGDELRVVATGNEVDSFSGLLQTGPALAGIDPPIGPSPVRIDHTRPFEVSWTPEGKEATVLLSVPYSGGICYCDAPDSAGRLVVDANLLSPISAEKNGNIRLARLTVSKVTASNATIDLVGAVVQEGPLAIE